MTRLIWEKKSPGQTGLHDADRRFAWSGDGKEETVWDWLAAVNRGGGLAGYSDWRIPNVKELFSLFDGERRDPSIAAAFAAEDCADLRSSRCSATAAYLYWSSTTLADFPALALAVNFSAPGALEHEAPAWVIRVVGGIEPHDKTSHMAVRAVRGPVNLAP